MNNKPTFFQNVAGMFKDKQTAFRDKLLIVGGILYILSPVDLIPDFIVLLGYTDDLAVAIGTYRLFRRVYNDFVRRSQIVSEQHFNPIDKPNHR
ncbi:YkvA family protein [Tumebacillus amylolyticus]|nr:YkvA family protein [Tumebacillus amylolyticus]